MDELWELLSSEKTISAFNAIWPWLLAGTVMIAKWVRASTLHWTLWPRTVRIVGLMIEILDFVHLPKLKPGRADFEKADQVAHSARTPEKRRKISERVNLVKIKTGEYPKVQT